jgi:glycosyltransferase involved in cell wall biosynthesis
MMNNFAIFPNHFSNQVPLKFKKIIPSSIKFPLWWLFKSPQRKTAPSIILADLAGIAFYIYRSLIPVARMKRISICTGLYNRTDQYTNHLLPSIQRMKNKGYIELSVYDCGSTDIKNLESVIRKQWEGSLVFSSEQRAFSRSYALNKAIAQSNNEYIFICDADMSLPPDFVEKFSGLVTTKSVWYPIYFFLFPNKQAVVSKENGVWETYGSKGMFGAHKKTFIKAGQLNEDYQEWGHEDTDLWERFHQYGYIVIRNKQKNFFHHWHNTFNPKYKHLNEE